MKPVPQIVKDEAKELINSFAGQIKHLGKYEDADVYIFDFAEPVSIGFPEIYLVKDNKVETVSDFIALEIIDSLVENVDKIDVK